MLIGGGPINAAVRQSMKQRFNPDRQGAAHVLERSDIAIVRGTPVYTADGSLHDNRIRISVNGFAERALWIDYPMDNPTGLRSEFHRWASQLTTPGITPYHACARNPHTYCCLGRDAVLE